MIIKKPSVFIYTIQPDNRILKEICAGIEEEGVFYELSEFENGTLDELAWNAANDSIPGSGVGIIGNDIARQMRGIPKSRQIESYHLPSREQSRKLGANSARAVKKQPFK